MGEGYNRQKIKAKSDELVKYYPLIFTIIFVLILFQYNFSSLEALAYDYRIKLDIHSADENEVVLITLDEESDEFLGEKYPYTYASHQKMMTKLLEDEPNVINYFISLLEAESEMELTNLEKFKLVIKNYQNKGGHFRFSSEMDSWGEVAPPQNLREIGYSLAMLHEDSMIFSKDGISRRAIINISGEDTLHYWTANKYRESKNKERLEVKDIKGAYYIRKADATFALFKYLNNPTLGKKIYKTIPFHRVMVGNFPKGFFKNKMVLIGTVYESNEDDFVLTPFNRDSESKKRTSKLSLHGHIIQALSMNQTVYPVSKNFTYTLCILITIILSLTISKAKPSLGLKITIAILFGLVLLSFLFFYFLGWWIYTSHLLLTVFVVYYIWVPFRAIGEYQRRYAIQEESKILKKVEKLKQNFISLMSHDLKTPVAKIAGMADVLMQKNRGDMELTQGLQVMVDSTKELNNFITSILDLTKVESQDLSLNTISKDINPIIEGIVEGLRYEASQKNIAVELDLDPLYPIQVDIILFKRFISNLVENAIKYSGGNSTVSVKTYDDEQWVYIDIKDNGVGIPTDDIEHIFEKFYRVKNDASHKIKGTGLGLYLVKYFIELHGGDIHVESEINKGTKFCIKLKNA